MTLPEFEFGPCSVCNEGGVFRSNLVGDFCEEHFERGFRLHQEEKARIRELEEHIWGKARNSLKGE